MRTTKLSRSDTERQLHMAAIELISRYGFEGMNLRMLADAIGIKAGSLYNYIDNKQALLFHLLESIMIDMIEGLDATLAEAATATGKLERLVSYHIRTHIERKNEVFIGNMELRSLSEAQRQRVVSLRRDYERRVVDIIKMGRQSGECCVQDEKVAAYAVIAMLTGVYNWYRTNRPMTLGTVIDMHVEMVMGLLGWNRPGRTTTLP